MVETTEPFTADVIDPPDLSAAATGLVASPRCDEADPRIGVVEFSWTPARTTSGVQRIQVTADPAGFADGGIVTGPQLPPSAIAHRWVAATAGQAVHTWRVITADSKGWITSPIAQFEGPLCAVDLQPG